MKKRNFLLSGFNAFTLAERICGSAGAKLQAGKGGLAAARSAENGLNPSPLAKFRTADKPVSESRNHGSGSEVMTGASAKEFQDAGEGAGVRGNNGFTLAEVLITLVIIGVIGALTVPALIQNTQKQEYVSALKKAYSTLSQVTQQIIEEEGAPKCADGGWACSEESGNEHFYEYYKKHLNVLKDCGASTDCFPQKGAPNGTGTYKSLNNYSSSDWNTAVDNKVKNLVLADGMQLRFEFLSSDCSHNSAGGGSSEICAFIWTDVNGVKAPNTYGRDMFSFVLKNTGLYPLGCESDVCIGNNNGNMCTCRVLTEGAMNY